MESDTEPAAERRCHGKRNIFLVEVVIGVISLTSFPMAISTELYILEWIRDELLENKASLNETAFHNHTFKCGNSSYSMNSVADQAQYYSSMFAILKALVSGIPALFSTVLLGTLSDQRGRRYAVLPPLVGIILKAMTLTVIMWRRASIWFFLPGSFVDGLCGYFVTLQMGCVAYIADVTQPHRRIYRMTVLELVVMVTSVLGSAGFGRLLGSYDHVTVMTAVIGILLGNFLYSFAFLPNTGERRAYNGRETGEVATGGAETAIQERGIDRKEGEDLREDNRRDEREREIISDETIGSQETGDRIGLLKSDTDAAETEKEETRTGRDVERGERDEPEKDEDGNKSENIKRNRDRGWCRCLMNMQIASEVFRRRDSQMTHRKLKLLVSAFFLHNLPSMDHGVLTLFQMNAPLCWTVTVIGTYTSVKTGLSSGGGLVTAPLFKRCLSDAAITLMAGSAAMVTDIYKAFVSNSAMMFSAVSLSPLVVLLKPSLLAQMSTLVQQNEQGAIFSWVACAEILCVIFGPVIFNAIYAQTLTAFSFINGFVFLTTALFHFVACLCTLWVLLLTKKSNEVLNSSATDASA